MSLSREYFEGEEEVLPQEEQEDATTQKMKELQQEVNIDAKASEIQEKTEAKLPSETPTQDTDTPTGDSFEEAFPGSEDPESYNYRSTNKDGTMRLREGEIIGPTREQGSKEPSGYMLGSIQDPKVGSPLKPFADALEGPVKGVHDWFSSEINSKAHIWGYPEIPRAKNVNNEVQDALRDVTALLAPIIAYTRGGKSLGKGLHAKGVGGKNLTALGNDKVFQAFANLGMDVGIGVYVDSTAYQQGEDDNLSGSIKKWFPQATQWIPNWLATSDIDSPDTKRHKNRLEGGGLNVGIELIGSLSRLTKAAYKAGQQAQWLPKGERMPAFWENIVGQYKGLSDKELSMKLISDSAEEASKNVDDLGAYNLSKVAADAPLEQPIKGVHDMWDAAETAQRTVDKAGVAGAMTDVARIKDNLGTQYGRVGSMISSIALKFGLEEQNLKRGWAIDKVVEQMKEAGQWDYLLEDGTKLKFNQIKQATTELAETLFDPTVDSGFLTKILNEFATTAGRKTAGDVASKTIRKYMEKISGMEQYVASALTQQSLAGQAADLAQTAVENLDTATAGQVIEEMYDRLEMLHVLKSMYDWEYKQGSLNPNLWNRVKNLFKNDDIEGLTAWKNSEEATRKKMLEDIIPEAKQFAKTYKDIAKEAPEMLKPFYIMYDATNGRVDSMYKLNKEFAHSFSRLDKAVFDKNPEIPNLLVQAGWANVMNSWLSALGTPITAALGNIGGIIMKPIGMYGGAMVSGDWYGVRRAHAAFGGAVDTFQKSMKYSGDMFWKLSTEPRKYEAAMKPDLAYKFSEKLEGMRAYAEAAEKMGNDGPMILYDMYSNLEEMALHPLLRGTSNAMSGQDLFTGAFLANVQARADAFDVVNGKISMDELVNTPLRGDELFDEAYNIAYSKIFNDDGIITDPRVRYANSEISLNADDPVANRLNQLTRSFPIAKSVFSFARSMGNMVTMYAVKYNPATPFIAEMPLVGELVDDVYKFIKTKPLHKISPAEMQEAMASRGMGDLPEDQMIQKFIEIRHEAKARMAIGTTVLTTGFLGAMAGNIRGNGSWDPEVQRGLEARKDWMPKSYRIPGTNKWMSYEFMGPVGDWLATGVDLVENWDTLGEASFENLAARMSFVMAANLKDKNVFAMARPLFDVVNGNEGAYNRWVAGTVNGMIPGAGLRSEMGRLFEPAQREIDRTVMGYIRNKNKFADAAVPAGARLPISNDWIYGKPIGAGQGSWWMRAWNVYFPMKITDEMGPEARFLAASEYDSRPQLNVDENGVEYTVEERAELYEHIGKDGIFLEGIRKVMKRAEKAGGMNLLMQYRKNPNVDSKRTPTDKWFSIHDELDYYLSQAVESARLQLSTRERLQTEAFIQDSNMYRAERGQPPLTFQTEQFLRNSVNK